MCLLLIHLKWFGLETNCSCEANFGVKVSFAYMSIFDWTQRFTSTTCN